MSRSILTISHRAKEISWWLYLHAALPSTEPNCPMRKWISHWATGCWITFDCLEIATLQQSVCPHFILESNRTRGCTNGARKCTDCTMWVPCVKWQWRRLENKWRLHCAACRFWARHVIKACRRTTVKWIGLGMQHLYSPSKHKCHHSADYTTQPRRRWISFRHAKWTYVLTRIELDKIPKIIKLKMQSKQNKPIKNQNKQYYNKTST